MSNIKDGIEATEKLVSILRHFLDQMADPDVGLMDIDDVLNELYDNLTELENEINKGE